MKLDVGDYRRMSLEKWHWGNGYARFGFWNPQTGKTEFVYMHRLIMDCPVGLEVHHLNGNKLDNRRCNLRIVNHAGHMAWHAREKRLAALDARGC